ncbi:cytochrome C [Zobellella denitrificans]|uniref:Cytochrome C n=1 Tax=Zobellella denitrificans TaxID=347534 RepID=A0A231MZI2_9GAMM|nr:cytochrome c [Zobellella denitrificans]ATG75639.1 cytochrome C [Zobellella denitrificans]OXS15578.1 cytochrome C [Zobellella denitrificans]
MKKLMTAAALMALIGAPAFAAGDAEAGKAKSAVCAACHGAEGISAMDIYPNLAGQKAAYTVKQLKAFRDGERNDPVMAPMAKPLSDQDIEDLAAYYAGL